MELMLDLETLGDTPNTAVLSIGACLFDPDSKTVLSTFYYVLNIDDQIKMGRTVSFSTVKWWISQNSDAKKVFDSEQISTRRALEQFLFWIYTNSDNRGVNIWGNGATFDVSIKESMLDQFQLKHGWKYNQIMDLRTFKRFVGKGKKIERLEGTEHNALSDALNQAKYVMDSWNLEPEKSE